MTKDLALSPWNEKNIFENGLKFLAKKNEQLDIYNQLWTAAYADSSFYSDQSYLAGKKFAAVAERSVHEIKELNTAAINLLDQELAKDFSSERSKQLLGICSASQAALNYFTYVANDTFHPSYFQWGLANAQHIARKVWLPSVITTLSVEAAEAIRGKEILPLYAEIGLTVGMLALPLLYSIRHIINYSKTNPYELRNTNLYRIFLNTLAVKPEAS